MAARGGRAARRPAEGVRREGGGVAEAAGEEWLTRLGCKTRRDCPERTRARGSEGDRDVA